MSTWERIADVLENLGNEGNLTTREIADHIGMTRQTVNRYLRIMEQQHVASRVRNSSDKFPFRWDEWNIAVKAHG